MKLLFSETTPDYAHYVYPYVVWGFPEPGETPADAFSAGFLPAAPDLSRYYLVRQVRVPLAEWRPSSENRRLLRKAAGIRAELFPRAAFPDTPERRARWLAYAEARFGPGVMSAERLDGLMGGRVISHLLHFTAADTGAELGTVLMHLESPRVAYYYFSFYDLGHAERSLGMQLMTRAVEQFAAGGYTHLYLGTCVTAKALYKVQFEPMEFFNGFRWSRDMDELRHLVRTGVGDGHRLLDPEFLARQPADLPGLAASSAFRAG